MSTTRSRILKSLAIAANAGFAAYGASALLSDSLCATVPEKCSPAFNLIKNGSLGLTALVSIGTAHWLLFGNRETNNQATVSTELNESTPLNRV